MKQPLITREHIGESGIKYILEYFECDSFDHLPQSEIRQCHAVALHKDKMVIVHDSKRNTWGLVGGRPEEGETPEETLIREIKEESNMKVISCKPVGYQRVTNTENTQDPYYQLRYLAIVEPYGSFVSDPDLSIDRIQEINPNDYKKFFDHFEIGDAIIKRALSLR